MCLHWQSILINNAIANNNIKIIPALWAFVSSCTMRTQTYSYLPSLLGIYNNVQSRLTHIYTKMCQHWQSIIINNAIASNNIKIILAPWAFVSCCTINCQKYSYLPWLLGLYINVQSILTNIYAEMCLLWQSIIIKNAIISDNICSTLASWDFVSSCTVNCQKCCYLPWLLGLCNTKVINSIWYCTAQGAKMITATVGVIIL